MSRQNEKLKIMVLGLRGFPDVQGGIETHAGNLYPLLAPHCDIEVLARSPYMPETAKTWRGITFMRLWSPAATGVEAFVHTLVGVLYAAIRRPDILHIHAIGPGVMVPLARLLGLKVVLTHHGKDYDRQKWGGFAKWLLRLGERWGVRWASNYITVARYLLDELHARGFARGEFIPNGVVIPEKVSTTAALEQFGLEPGRYVLMVSRMVPEKRHDDLIRAFRESGRSGRRLVLVGDHTVAGSYAAGIRELATGGDVVLAGFQSGKALAELYSHAEMFVLPSSHEGLPIALLEALSYGLHAIASDIPAHLELELSEEHYYGLGDVSALSRRIDQAPVGGLPPVEQERQIAMLRERYDWQQIAGRTLALYQGVLSSPDSGEYISR